MKVILFAGAIYTYEFMDQQANRVANMMRGLGLKFGDTVALMCHNEPAFVWTFLGELLLTFYDRQFIYLLKMMYKIRELAWNI